jgi:hypothetical protein
MWHRCRKWSHKAWATPLSVGGQQIEVLRHAGLLHIGINRLRAEEDHIVAPLEEFQYRIVQRRER